ncbi:hypothetical protein AWENTII_000242 [Aspergillus wentii]
MSSTFFQNVPSDTHEWEQAAIAARVLEVTQKQFLLYRTICLAIEVPDRLRISKFNYFRLRDAERILRESITFQNYILAISLGQTLGLGDFGLVLEQQLEIREVLEDPIKMQLKLTEFDESIVNTSLIYFLQALTRTIPPDTPNHPRCKWRLKKIALRAHFGNVNGQNHGFVAITDGQMQDITTGRIKAIGQCKKGRRQNHTPQVDMQEASELVALIMEYPDGRLQRVMISQDGDEIYITFAQYGTNWVKHINCQSVLRPGFMILRRFGPWKIGDPADMKHLATIMLTIILG